MKYLKKQKKTIIYAVAVLAMVGVSFLTYNFIAKGATYGWLQASWSGGADTGAVANHTDNKTGWTKFFSKDSNVVTDNDQLTLSSGSSSVVQTTTAQFDAGTKDIFMLDTSTVTDQVSVNFNYFNASGICTGLKGVYYIDYGLYITWANAMSGCVALCPTCALPTITELQCIYTNRASFGNNFIAAAPYWSSIENGTNAFALYFNGNGTTTIAKTNATSVRCVRR